MGARQGELALSITCLKGIACKALGKADPPKAIILPTFSTNFLNLNNPVVLLGALAKSRKTLANGAPPQAPTIPHTQLNVLSERTITGKPHLSVYLTRPLRINSRLPRKAPL